MLTTHPLPGPELDSVRLRLEGTCGLRFDARRREALSLAVSQRMRASGYAGVAEYLAALNEADEFQALIDEVVIPETQFLRNQPQMRALRAHVLPELARAAVDGGRPVCIWSAGCSTGEEAFSLALLVRQAGLAETAGWQITGTDISGRALQAARAGRYSARSTAAVPKADLARYFEEPDSSGACTVGELLRRDVQFRQHNLVSEAPPFADGAVDLVLCRNVTIYFARATTVALIERVHRVLRPGGYLLLGHAETLWRICADFNLVRLGEAFLYRKPPLPAAAAATTAALPAPPPASGPRRRVAKLRQPVVAGTGLRAALRSGRNSEAVALAVELIASEPLVAEWHYLQGLALANLGDAAQATDSLRKALYLDPDHGAAYFLLGTAFDRLGEFRAAVRTYRQAAAALRRRPARSQVGEFGGRRPEELPELCLRLAERAERAPIGPEGR